MSPSRWHRIAALVEAAVAHRPGERSAFLARECIDDEPLRQQVEEFILAYESTASFLDIPAAVRHADLLDSPPAGGGTRTESEPEGEPAEGLELTPGCHLRQYEIIRPLGSGGMGVVYLARDTVLGRLVAVKFLTRHNPAANRRFIAEARATARCSHENIVVIHEVGEHQERPFMILEYVAGKTLRQWLQEQASLDDNQPQGGGTPSGRVLDIMVPVARALVTAHELGLVHRDLKPANIMLTERGTIKVLDFGIAKLLPWPRASRDMDSAPADLLHTSPGSIVGTLPYMSPEQLQGADVDHRSDIWAVGIMLFELLTHHHPLAPLTRARLREVADHTVPMPSLVESRPDLEGLAAIVDRCLIKDRAHRLASAQELVAELEALTARGRQRAPLGDGNPFAGLAAFQESDAGRFFGREHETALLLQRMRNRALVAVAGPSGSGKSSLVRAGLIPELKRTGEGWHALTLRPGRRPLAALAELIDQIPWTTSQSRASTGDPSAPGAHGLPADEPGDLQTDDAQASPQITQRLRREPGYLGTELRSWARRKRRRLLLFVDQFEELYTLCADADERAAFASCLCAIADDAASPLRVVLSVRSDLLDRVAEDEALMVEISRGLVFLPPMTRTSLRDALVAPVEAHGYRFESEAMVEEFLAELAETRTPLPLLQFAAASFWRERDRERRLLSEHSYRAMGGIAGALASHADTALAAMSSEQREHARAVFFRLVTPERTRAVVALDELLDLPGGAEVIEPLLRQLADARLVAIESAADERGSATVELVHESLIERWPTLRRWLDEHRDDAAFLARLEAAAKQWQTNQRAPGMLWRDQAVAQARQFQRRYRGPLSGAADEFLAAVFALADRSRRRRRWLLGGGFVAAVVLALAMTLLAAQRGQARNRAAHEATLAERAAKQARADAVRARDATRMAAAREYQSDPTTVIALLREVEQPESTRDWVTLANRARLAGPSWTVLDHDAGVNEVAFHADGQRFVTVASDARVRVWRLDALDRPLVLEGHRGPLTHLSVGRDIVVTSSVDHTARVWSLDTGDPIAVLAGHQDWILWTAISPDGTQVATSSRDGTARVWQSDGTADAQVLQGHQAAVDKVQFSADGQRLLTASSDRTARIFSLAPANATNAEAATTLVLSGHQGAVASARFSPDNALVVTSSEDGTARLWRAQDGTLVRTLVGHRAPLRVARFSPDGRLIATAASDGSARIWTVADVAAPRVLESDTGDALDARFSPDGRHVAVAVDDDAVQIWRIDGSGRVRVLRGHQKKINRVAFSPDGTQIATASRDATARLWSFEPARYPTTYKGHKSPLRSVEFDPATSRMVTTSDDRAIRIWDPGGREPTLVLTGHEAPVYNASFSPDGTRIVSASADGTARLWQADGATPSKAFLQRPGQRIWDARFSPDGSRIATSTAEGAIQLWNADGTGPLRELRGHAGDVVSVAFSRDGKKLASASVDTTARIWNLETDDPPVLLEGHGTWVWSAEFSPDGTRVLTASHDRLARIWPVTGGPPVVELSGHDDSLWTAVFSPDGTLVVTASSDDTVRVWRADGTGEPLILEGHRGNVHAAVFSRDGRRISSASADTTARIWSDIEALDLGDARLWSLTDYCIPVSSRRRILGHTEREAITGRDACRARTRSVPPEVP